MSEQEPLRKFDRDYLPTQHMDRIAQGLSPCDDYLPFAQALRQKQEMDKASAEYKKRQKRGRDGG